ncbi:MAG TPA: inositol monophosphatase family protein [Candidatus Tectomicrobia bacterium]|nr:inositol monophosphatase family protein [Candidatus Tectomicrobia bacterium]
MRFPEGTNVTGRSGVCWVLDPLDGTTNFVHGYPAYAVAVGVEIDGQRVIGMVHDTSYDCVYSGMVGVGTPCDGRPISALQPQTVTVRRRIAPPPAAAKLHATVSDHAASQPDGPCHGYDAPDHDSDGVAA